MSENIDELRNMLVTFRVSELQMLLGFAGRNKTGRKTELQQRALELLRVRSHPIQQKIKELYKTIQGNQALTSLTPKTLSTKLICGDHFKDTDFKKKDRSLLLRTAVPIRQSGALNQNHIQTSPTTTPSGTPSPNMPQHQGNVPRATVHPYNMDTRQLSVNTRSTTMYNQNMYHYPQYTPRTMAPSQPIMNPSYPIHPDVEFKMLPFFDILSELVKPSTLMPQNNSRQQECNFFFHLTPQQATDIAASRDVRHGNRGGEYTKQIQMRFCLMETSCKQEDYFPPGLIVKVNNKQCPLPNPVPTNKPGVEPKRPPRPVNITQFIKLSPTTANSINVQWVPDFGRAYAITINLVHKRNSVDLLNKMKVKGAKHSDHTRGIIKEKLTDQDQEIATTSLKVSLMCPLGKMRMANPCRAKTCQHLQCFDASLYLQMNERKPTWNCPVCDKPASYEELEIDGYFMDVLCSSLLGSDTNEIMLNKDGSWSIQQPDAKPAAPAAQIQKVTPLDDSIEIICDDIEVVTPASATSSTDKLKEEETAEVPATPTAKEKSVVDLTLSDSDDDEPLAKRRALNPKPDSTNKFSDTTSISSSSNQSRVSVTPGPSSVSSSGYPISPSGVITLLDSPSPPPSSPQSIPTTSQLASCMMSNGSTQNSLFGSNNMPMLDLENEAASGINYFN